MLRKISKDKYNHMVSVLLFFFQIYMNDDLAHSKQGTSKPLIACVHHEAADEDECDAVYQNVSKVEDIYCNQS